MRKGILIITLFLILSCLCFSFCYAQTDWYVLLDDEKPIEEFLLESGQKKDIIINSNEDVWVGFKTDATSQQFDKYYKEYPLKLTQEETGAGVDSVMGGATIFKPRDNKIKTIITNESGDNFNILIYTKEKQ
jgi:hypothetical protein